MRLKDRKGSRIRGVIQWSLADAMGESQEEPRVYENSPQGVRRLGAMTFAVMCGNGQKVNAQTGVQDFA